MRTSSLRLPLIGTARARRVVAFALLSATAIGIAVARHVRGPAAASAQTDGAPPAAGNGGSADFTAGASPAPVVVTWPIEMQRDPFVWQAMVATPATAPTPNAAAVEREANESIHLQAIAFAGESPRVIINGSVRQRGESIGGFIIQRIEQRYVVLEKSGITVRVDLRSTN